MTQLLIEDGEVQPARQNIKDLVKARVKEHGKPRPWKILQLLGKMQLQQVFKNGTHCVPFLEFI